MVGYIGFDPTSDSLHIGSLVQLIILKHFQQCGHKPIVLIGGATGMIGDPSGKSKERNLLDEETLNHNLKCMQAQLEKFLDFDCGENSAVVVNNYEDIYVLFFLYYEMKIDIKNITEGLVIFASSCYNRLAKITTQSIIYPPNFHTI